MFYENVRENALYYNSERDCLCSPHIHKAVEFLYVLSGEKPVLLNEMRFTLNKGELLVCMPFDVHAYGISGGIQRCAAFPVEYCGAFFSAVRNLTLKNNVFSGEFAEEIVRSRKGAGTGHPARDPRLYRRALRRADHARFGSGTVRLFQMPLFPPVQRPDHCELYPLRKPRARV